jgi:hypothetical protein
MAKTQDQRRDQAPLGGVIRIKADLSQWPTTHISKIADMKGPHDSTLLMEGP